MNFQHAIDYFWSAPKEVMTQLRPNTWGNLYLAPQQGSPQTAQNHQAGLRHSEAETPPETIGSLRARTRAPLMKAHQ